MHHQIQRVVDLGHVSGAQEVVLEQVSGMSTPVKTLTRSEASLTLRAPSGTCPTPLPLSSPSQLRNLSLLLGVDLGLLTGDQAALVLAVNLKPRPTCVVHLEAR